MDKPFVLHISGYSCAGKSTLSKVLEDKLPGMYAVSYDRLKWQLAGYDRNKDGPLVDSLTMGFFEVICRHRIPILLDSYFKNEEEYSACKKIAEGQGYVFKSLELKAPLEVRLERFHNRVAEAKKLGTKVSVTDDDTFLKNAEKKFYLPEDTPRFDTSLTSIEDIANQVVAFVA